MADIPYKHEVWRKLIHLGALSMPIGYFLASKSLALIVISGCLSVSIVIDLSRIHQWRLATAIAPLLGPVFRQEENKRLSGATFILGAGLLMRALFPVPIAAAGMVYIILGDIAAALVGRRFGRHRFRNKSLEGSIAFLIAAALGSLAIPVLPAGWLLVGALVATIVEAFPWRIDDNLTVPLASGLLLFLVTHS